MLSVSSLCGHFIPVQMEFMVHWTGYAPTDNTWQLESSMKSPQLIDAYWERVRLCVSAAVSLIFMVMQKRHDARVDMQSLPERDVRARIVNALSSTSNCQGYRVHSVRPSESALNRVSLLCRVPLYYILLQLIVEIDYESEIHKLSLDAILKQTLEEWNSVCRRSGIAPLRLVNDVDFVHT